MKHKKFFSSILHPFIVRKAVMAFLLCFVSNCVFAGNAENVSVDNPQIVSEAQAIFQAMSTAAKMDPVSLDDFIRQFPNSSEAHIAFALRYTLLKNNKSIEEYNRFIDLYPEKLQTQVAMSELFDLYLEQNTVPGYYDFIQRYPNTMQAMVAIRHIEQLMYEFVETINTDEDYDAFIEAFPNAPQVNYAKEKAMQVALEKEQALYNAFLKKNPKADYNQKKGFASIAISQWEQDVEETRRLKNNNPEIIHEISYQVKLIKLERRSDVLLKVYAEVNDGRIERCRGTNLISEKLETIKNTIEKNHEELIKKMNEETDRICKRLELLHQDNVRITGTLRKGFNKLHEDLNKIHKDMKEIKETLDDMDRQLHNISNTLATVATGGSATAVNIAGDCFHGVVKQLTKPNNPQDNDSDCSFSESTTMTTLNYIAQNGYDDRCSQFWESSEAIGAKDEMEQNIQRIPPSGSKIARYLGFLAASYTERIPVIGNKLTSSASKLTVFSIDRFGMHFSKTMKQKIEKEGELKWVFIGDSANVSWTKLSNDLSDYLPKLLKEEKDNYLEALNLLIPDVEESVDNPDVVPITRDDVSMVNYRKVNPKVIDFYKKRLMRSSKL